MIETPQKIVCVGLNYRDHAEEQGVDLPERPLLFAKWPNTLIADDDPIRIPEISKQVDYEAELGVVIGGIRIGSPGPISVFGHFAKRSGRSGSAVPCSSAWSR